jgi:hypothetical protein
MGDLEYFRAVYEELESGGIESLMHDLLLYDLDASGIDLRTIPDTHARQIMRAASLSDVSLFWREWLQTAVTSSCYLPGLHVEYLETKPKYAASLPAFVEEIKALCPSGREDLTIGNAGRKVMFDIGTIERAREEYEETTKIKVRWFALDKQVTHTKDAWSN